MEPHLKKTRRRGSQACTFCNRRKIRCDGKDPCGECKLRNQRCLYSHTRIKRGPKRGKKWQSGPQISRERLPSTSQSPVTYDELGFSFVLPPSSISYLVTIFWHNIHPFWPMFARSGIDDLLKLSHCEPLLFNAMIAITAKTQAHPISTLDQSNEGDSPKPKPIISQDQVSTLIEQIRRNVATKELPLRLQSIQTWILMALSELGGGAHDFAFHCSAQASLMAIEMGLHKRNSDKNAHSSEKATFWCVYVLDKMLAVMLGKPMLVRKSDISCESKFIDQDQIANSPPLGLREGDSHLFIYQEYIKLMIILQDIIEDVYTHAANITRTHSTDGLGESYLKSVQIHQRSLQGWKQNLPDWIEQRWQNNRSDDGIVRPHRSRAISNIFLLQSVTLEAWYHACLLLLHRPLFGFEQQHSTVQYTNKEVQRGHTIVCQSATSITRCLRCYQRRNTARCIPSSWIFLTFLSAVIHITCIHDGITRLLPPHRICFDDCIALLREISQTWKHAGRQVENLYVISSQITGQSAVPLQEQQLNRTYFQPTPISHSGNAQTASLEVDIDTLWNDLLLSFEPGDAVLG